MAYLTLEDGTIFKGEAFGAKIDIMGEVAVSYTHLQQLFGTGITGDGMIEVIVDEYYA